MLLKVKTGQTQQTSYITCSVYFKFRPIDQIQQNKESCNPTFGQGLRGVHGVTTQTSQL